MTCYLNQPASFLSKAKAKDAMAYISGPQIVRKEIQGKNILVHWGNGAKSLAPVWWFQKWSEVDV